MSSSKKRKEKIYDVYSKNFQFVKNHKQIRINPDIPNSYMCPICFEGFEKQNLNVDENNYLTAEDVPPKKLGGKPTILTCKKCNSFAGHDLDIHLINMIHETSFYSLEPNSCIPTVLEKDGFKMNGITQIDKSGKWTIDLDPNRSNPKHTKEIIRSINNVPGNSHDIESLSNFDIEEKSFNLKFTSKANYRKGEIDLLRIAYLKGFEVFGYSFLINPNLLQIRQQIRNPTKSVLRNTFWIKHKFNDSDLGIHLIYEPKQLRSILVVFKLANKTYNKNFGIILPGPSNPGMKIYDYLNDVICVGDGTKFTDINMLSFKKETFISKEKNAFVLHDEWQKMEKEYD